MMSYAMRQQVQKATDKRVEAINRNNHKVWVSPETMKKHPGEYKPAPKDKGHDAHQSEHHESAPQIVKESFHGKPISKDKAEERKKQAAEGVKSKECQEVIGSITKNTPTKKQWDDMNEMEQETFTENVVGGFFKGSVLGGVLGHAAAGWASYAVVGATAVSVSPVAIGVGAAIGALAFMRMAKTEMGVDPSVSIWKVGAEGDDLKKKIEKAIASPTMKDLERAAHVTDGKGGLCQKKVHEIFGIKEGKKASLRSRTIRLAHENPELRKHLLPLLRGTP